MMSLISSLGGWWVPILLSPILASLTKFNDKPTWKRIWDTVMTKKTPSTTTIPAELLKVIPGLLEQLLRKPPPVAPDEQVPVPAIDIKSPQDFIAYIVSLLATPDSQKPIPGPENVAAPVEHHCDFASLVACADAVAKANPDCDIMVTIDENEAKATKVKREPKPKQQV